MAFVADSGLWPWVTFVWPFYLQVGSKVTQACFLSILGLLCFSVLNLVSGTGQTDRRSDGQQPSMHNVPTGHPVEAGHNNAYCTNVLCDLSAIAEFLVIRYPCSRRQPGCLCLAQRWRWRCASAHPLSQEWGSEQSATWWRHKHLHTTRK